MRPKCIRVRARSEKEGSGIVGLSPATLVPACFLLVEEDIVLSGSLNETRADCFPRPSSAKLLLGFGRKCHLEPPSGSSSAVERQLPKLDVAGSIPVSRSIFSTRRGIVAAHPSVESPLAQIGAKFLMLRIEIMHPSL